MSSRALPLLSLLVWLPFLGAGALFWHRGGPSGGRRAAGLAATLPSLVLAVVAVAAFDPAGPDAQLVELYHWAPALGISYDLGVDGLGIVLVLWLALAGTLALALSKGGREAPLLLLLEGSLLGLAVARDAFLFLSFQGAAILWIFLLLDGQDARRRWLRAQLLGLLLFTGFVLVVYRIALDQTGFPSADTRRFPSLVVFAVEERRLFVLAGLAAWIAGPLAPFASWVAPTLEGLSSAGRVLFLGGVVLVPPFAVVRLALPVTAGGASSWGGWIAIGALVSLFYAGLAPRRLGLAPAVAGLSGLVLAALVAPERGVPAAGVALLGMGLALATLAIWAGDTDALSPVAGSRAPGALLALAVIALLAWPLGWGFLAPIARGSAWLGAAAAIGAALAAARLVAVASSIPARRGALLALPALLFWIALLGAPRDGKLWLRPAGGPPAPVEGASEEEP